MLLIGVDGMNLGRVLANPSNQRLLELMECSTTAASNIAGHATISNPSWTTILTGVWDTKSGVLNNVFTPKTYDRWPTVFHQLEAFNPAIRTKAVADWKVVADIACAGRNRAADVVYVPRVAGDADWSRTDAAVADETVKTIKGIEAGYENIPNFVFSYFVQVDENGHEHGGASPEYATAIARTNANVGRIMDAVAEREACGESWTVLMVTDHGHQPRQGLAHGFQSPDETSTFVIARGPDFGQGRINLKYQIVDITPTVLSLFGATPSHDSDGVPLSNHRHNEVVPSDLKQALADAIGMYGQPDIATTVALDLRTIAATTAAIVDSYTEDTSSQLRAVADRHSGVISGLAAILSALVQLVGDMLYESTNLMAQLLAALTGVHISPLGG